MTEGLGPKPEASTEEPERFPGGVDSVADEEKYGERPDNPTVPDLNPEANPAVDDKAPEEITEQDDKQQEPDTEDATDEEAGTPDEDAPEPPA